MILRALFWVEFRVLRCAVAWVPQLQHATLRRLARGLGWLGYVIDGRGRSTAHENLRCAFPDQTFEQRRSLAIRSYQSFARTFLELFWSPNLRHDVWRSMIASFEPADSTLEDRVRATGALWCTAHFGNFEWMSLFQAWRVQPMTVVAQDFKDGALTPLFASLRATAGSTLISSTGAMLRLFKTLKRGGHSAFLCDLTVPPQQPSTVIRCFGQLTCVTVIHAALAQRTGQPIIPMLAVPQPDGRVRLLQGHPLTLTPADAPRATAQAIWDGFEPLIRQFPEHWLWMYKHWRYLPVEASPESYPAYANRSKAFDRRWAQEREW
jgi:Kdo2-lipid IVA lauroyltransferase/acyltransferase